MEFGSDNVNSSNKHNINGNSSRHHYSNNDDSGMNSQRKSGVDNVTTYMKVKKAREEKKLRQLMLPTIAAQLPSPSVADSASHFRKKPRM